MKLVNVCTRGVAPEIMGLRLIVTLYYEMERLDMTVGGASLCVGGGPAMASLWTRDVE